jgi:hypothetical protein
VVDEDRPKVTCELTTPEVGEPTAAPSMLDQIVTPFETFMGDGTFDGEPVARAISPKHPDAKIVAPLHKTVVSSATGDTKRDQNFRNIIEHGRFDWQKRSDSVWFAGLH